MLLVDDEPSVLEMTKAYLEELHSIKAHTAPTAKEAIENLKRRRYDAIVCDYQMPDMDGLEFLRLLRSRKVAIPFILFTGRGREEVAQEAMRCGASFYLQKSGDPKAVMAELADMVRASVRMHEAEDALAKSSSFFWSLVDHSSDGILMLEGDGRISYCNPAALRLLRLPEEKVLGRSALDLMDSRDALRLSRMVEDGLYRAESEGPSELRLRCGSQGPRRLRCKVMSPDGEAVVLSLTESPESALPIPYEGAVQEVRRSRDLSREMTFRLISRMIVDRMNEGESAVSRNRFLPSEIHAKRAWDHEDGRPPAIHGADEELDGEVVGALIDSLAASIDYEEVDQRARLVEEANRKFYGPD